jgi:hypothetical protein
MFSLQVLGAVAQLERALIAERTKAGCAQSWLVRASRGPFGQRPLFSDNQERPSDVVWTSTRIQPVVMQNASRQQPGFSQDDVKMKPGRAQNAAC